MIYQGLPLAFFNISPAEANTMDPVSETVFDGGVGWH
jgi:hypothetical protein